MRVFAAFALTLCTMHAAGAAPAYRVAGDAIALPLEGKTGDAARGRLLAASKQQSLCLLCHSAPIPEERFQGDLAPSLAGAGARWNAGQLRLRLADASHINPATIMPSYYRSDGLQRVPAALRGRTILDAQQIEDLVAWLLTLKDPA
ncbi:MAG TPA: sulfur oxidation c-type cytochrome SoxX [Burkholderiaceae bacterium]